MTAPRRSEEQLAEFVRFHCPDNRERASTNVASTYTDPTPPNELVGRHSPAITFRYCTVSTTAVRVERHLSQTTFMI
jgi:hypothetical protein